MTPDLETIGLRLKVARVKKRLSIRELSKITGLAEPTISRMERGIHQPALYTVVKYAEAVDVTLAELFKE